MKKTTFAFDFDNTITRDPSGFLAIMGFLKVKGHEVHVVTGRLKEVYPEDLDFLKKAGYNVIFTNHCAKRDWCKEQEGLNIDVWVDDCPEAVYEGYSGLPRTWRDME
jgi:hypothetical protein